MSLEKRINHLTQGADRIEKIIKEREDPYRFLHGKGPYIINNQITHEGDDLMTDNAIEQKRTETMTRLDAKIAAHTQKILYPRFAVLKTQAHLLRIEQTKIKIDQIHVVYDAKIVRHQQTLQGLEDMLSHDPALQLGMDLLENYDMGPSK